MEPSVQPSPIAFSFFTITDFEVLATVNVTAPVASINGATTSTIRGVMRVGSSLLHNDTSIDDIFTAQVEWYMSSGSLLTGNFHKLRGLWSVGRIETHFGFSSNSPSKST